MVGSFLLFLVLILFFFFHFGLFVLFYFGHDLLVFFINLILIFFVFLSFFFLVQWYFCQILIPYFLFGCFSECVSLVFCDVCFHHLLFDLSDFFFSGCAPSLATVQNFQLLFVFQSSCIYFLGWRTVLYCFLPLVSLAAEGASQVRITGENLQIWFRRLKTI